MFSFTVQEATKTEMGLMLLHETHKDIYDIFLFYNYLLFVRQGDSILLYCVTDAFMSLKTIGQPSLKQPFRLKTTAGNLCEEYIYFSIRKLIPVFIVFTMKMRLQLDYSYFFSGPIEGRAQCYAFTNTCKFTMQVQHDIHVGKTLYYTNFQYIAIYYGFMSLY